MIHSKAAGPLCENCTLDWAFSLAHAQLLPCLGSFCFPFLVACSLGFSSQKLLYFLVHLVLISLGFWGYYPHEFLGVLFPVFLGVLSPWVPEGYSICLSLEPTKA